jgi:hypothetical protein
MYNDSDRLWKPSICREGLRKTAKKLRIAGGRGRDFKPGASNQETGALHIDHDLMFLYIGVPFIVSPGIAAFSYRNSISAGICHDRCRAQGHRKRNTL